MKKEMEKKITCYLSHNYLTYGRFAPNQIQPHCFQIENSHFESIEEVVREFEGIGFRKAYSTEAGNDLSVKNELAYLAVGMKSFFDVIDYEADRELREQDFAYYTRKGHRKGIGQFFRLHEICNSLTLGTIDFIDFKNGKESIESALLIDFIRRAIIEKFEQSHRDQSFEYLRFEYEKEVYENNRQGKNIGGTLRKERVTYALDLFAFMVYELNLTVLNQMYTLGAKLCFHSGFPFFIGKGSKEKGVYDSWDNDLIKQFRNIVNTRPHKHDDDKWCDIQFALIDRLPIEKREKALNGLMKKLR